ncbi:MAG: hypothetical protein JXA10_11230 [Anaerolineae bacterium]|nr:hypothetical protein [Anaerolineae bacterium]
MDEFKEIISALGPDAGGLGWSITLYVLFFVNVILLLMEGSSFGTNISIAVLLAIFIDKTFAFGYMFNPNDLDPELCHREVFFGTYIARVVMFAGPFAIAGATKNGKTRFVAIVAGIAGMVYMFMRWFMEQRDSKISGVTCMVDTDLMVQHVGLLLVLARITLRDRFGFGPVDRDIPVTVLGELAPDDSVI